MNDTLIFTKEDFEEGYNKIIDDRLHYLLSNAFDIYNENISKELISRINITYSGNNSDIEEKLDILANDIKFWSDNSFHVEDRKQVLMMIIGEQLYNKHVFCFSYFCSSDIIDDEMIDNIIYIQSYDHGEFDFDRWAEEAVDKFINELFDSEKDISNISKIDWTAIASNPEFDIDRSKYKCTIKENVTTRDIYK